MTDSSGSWARRNRERRGGKTEDDKGAGRRRGGTPARRPRRAKARTRRKPGRKDGETSPGDGESYVKNARDEESLTTKCRKKRLCHCPGQLRSMREGRYMEEHGREREKGRNEHRDEFQRRRDSNEEGGQIEDWRRRRLSNGRHSVHTVRNEDAQATYKDSACSNAR